MKLLTRVLATGATVAILSATVSTQNPVPGQPDLKAGDTAPDFSLQASDGQTYSLAKLKGKYVVLAWFPKAFTAG